MTGAHRHYSLIPFTGEKGVDYFSLKIQTVRMSVFEVALLSVPTMFKCV